MTNKNITITIVNHSKLVRRIGRAASIALVVLLPIAFGVLLKSDAMQWVGFVFGLIILIGLVNSQKREYQFTTVDEAKARLDQMKADGEAP